MSLVAFRRLALASSGLALAFALPGTANAATCNWLVAAGNWAMGSNWSCGNQPMPGDDAVITNAGAVVTLSGINAGAATINLGTGNAVNVQNGSTLFIYNNAVTNNGIFTISTGSDFRSASGIVNVTGTGAIVLDASNGNARLFSGGWMFGSGQVVRGTGQLGVNQTIFSNSGLISANVSGGNLSIDVTAGSGGVGAGNGFGTNGNAGLFNSGIMEATGGGMLSFESGLYENAAGGIIRAATSSTVSLNNDARIMGGTLTSVGTGAINTTAGNEYLTNVTLSAGSKLNVAANNTLYLNTGFVNNGTVTIDNTSDLRNETGTLTITGAGQIVLGSTGSNRLFGGNIVFGSNQNVTGQGQLGANQTVVTNNALFSVNTGGTLSIDVTAGSGGVGAGNGVGTGGNAGLLNNGVIEASGGSTIAFESGLYENAVGGIIRAATGSSVNLDNDARILGGTLTSVGTGAINTTGGNEYLSSVTLSAGSNLNVAANNTLYLNTVFTNNGTLTINNTSDLRNETGSLAINGTGTIILGSTGSNRLYGGTITFGAGQTVQGTGQLGANQTIFTINNVFSANAGTVLSVDVTAGSGGVGAGNGVGTNGNAGLLNNSTIQATGGSSLNFESGLYENAANGVIQALAGSAVNLDNDARIMGGTLTSVGTGAINTTAGNEYLTNVTLSAGSKLNVAANNTLYLNTGFVNNGTVTIDNTSDLRNETGTLTITGAGQIVLGSTGSNRLFGGNIVFGSNQNVTGQGQLGANQTVVTNNALFSVNTGGTLSIDVTAGSGGVGAGNGVGTGGNAGLLNNGVIEASGGSTIAFESGLYENAVGGIIRAATGSSVNLDNDARILGGTLTSVGTGAINTTGGNEYLSSVTLSAGSNLNVAANNTLYLNTVFTNNGTLTINNTSDLRNETGSLAINGTGTIILGSTGSNRLYGGTITFGAGQTVQGTGQLGANQTIFTINNVFSANAGTVLSVDVTAGSGGVGAGNGVGTNGNAGLLNNSTIQATGGSSLNFESGLYENAANGVIQALAGSAVNLDNDARIMGGTLTSVGTGAINTTAGNEYLTNVTLSAGSKLNVAANNTLYLNTGFVNNGTVTIDNTSDLRNETGTLTITGAGQIVLGSTGSNRLFGGNIVFGSNQNVTGQGQLGANQTVVTNNALFSVNTGGTLSIDVTAGSGGVGAGNGVGTGGNAGLLNNGVIEASGGSTIALESGLYENAATGIIRAATGSSVNIDNDARILNGTLTSIGTGAINTTGGNEYLNSVTLSAGSNLNVAANNTLYLNTVFTNNGTVTVNNTSDLRSETAALTIDGTGTIVLGTTGGNRLFGGAITIGAGQFVVGQGQIGINQTIISNSGNILASGGNITIDVSGGGGGVGAGNGVGTGGNAGFYNDNGGQVQANNGGATLTLASGLYENAARGVFSVGSGSSFNMESDANLVNLQAGGVLSKGLYFAFDHGTMNLRSYATGAINTIGTGAAGTDTSIFLTGPNSIVQVTPSGGSTTTTLDQSLNTIASSGALSLNNRAFTAQNGAFSNAGRLTLANGASFAAPAGFTNSGTVIGNGTVASAIANSGFVIADGGTLNLQPVTGTGGTIRSNAGGTLNFAGAGGNSTAGFLTNNGNLALGANNITVTSDYQNANFGTGIAFNRRASVTGSGLILAASATMDLSGPGLSGDTLNVGNVRLGGTSSTTLTITNNGTLTTLRGAVQSPVTNSVSISSDNYVVGPNGGQAMVTLSYTGTTAGSLSGNTINVVNNFDNVANRTLTITGAAYNPAAASLSPSPIDLGATRVGMGSLSGVVTITNTAPVSAFSEKLAVTSATGSAGASVTVPAGLINPGASAGSTVSIGSGTAGSYTGSVTYGLATDGTGTSGLARLALASQTVAVSGRVYQTANAQLAATNVSFGTVRQGAGSTSASLGVANTASGALTDSLTTSLGALPAGVTGTTPAPIAGGASGSIAFSHSNATAGNVTGSGTINFASTDPELAPLALSSQNVTFSGVVTELATASVFKNAGTGSFGGMGQTYTLNLGSFSGAGSVTTDLGVLNGNTGQSFSETLGGTFSAVGGTGYTFAGMTFAGLTGGSSDIGNLLNFNYTGLANGTYTNVLTFAGYSRYAGLADQTLPSITVNVTATVTGAVTPPTPGAVPEPSTWTMLILGFGAVGGAMRRRGRPLAMAAR